MLFTVLLQHNRKQSGTGQFTVNTQWNYKLAHNEVSSQIIALPCNWSHDLLSQTYLGFCSGNSGQEDDVSHQEADAQVQVDGGAGALDGAAELERQDAQDQTQYGEDQAYLCQQNQLKGVLEERTRQILTLMTRPIWEPFTQLLERVYRNL